ncbi:hypothetical protein HOY80DRAFT_1058946 [Tuber brumale]|nr:hypothetical protein HOY80DRAFT_1058946 [Tuber brumale]
MADGNRRTIERQMASRRTANSLSANDLTANKAANKPRREQAATGRTGGNEGDVARPGLEEILSAELVASRVSENVYVRGPIWVLGASALLSHPAELPPPPEAHTRNTVPEMVYLECAWTTSSELLKDLSTRLNSSARMRWTGCQ